MDISSVNSDIIRGNVTTMILGSLFGGDRYGYDILNEIAVKSDGKYVIKQPTLYSNLKRMEKQGLIESYLGELDDTGGGRRRYYRLTEDGTTLYLQLKNEYVYARTIVDRLVSDEEFDFDSEKPPFDAEALRPLTKRIGEKEVEVIREVPVEVIKEVPVEVIREVPVEVVRELPTVREIPVEIPAAVVQEVPVEIIKEVPVEIVREVPVEKEIVFTREIQSEKEVPTIETREIEVVREVPHDVYHEIDVVREISTETPVETLREVEVVREVPVEVIREIEVVREVETEKPVENVQIVERVVEKPVEVLKEIEVIRELDHEVAVEHLREVEVEVIREVPVETFREVEVVREVPVERTVYVNVGIPSEAAAVVSEPESPSFEAEVVDYRSYFQGILAMTELAKEDETPLRVEVSPSSEKNVGDLKNRLYAKGYKMRPYIKAQSMDYYRNNYVRSSVLNADVALIMTLVMLAEEALFWIFLKCFSPAVFISIMAATTLFYVVPLAVKLMNPLKRSKSDFNLKLAFLYRCMIYIELTVVAVLFAFFVFDINIKDSASYTPLALFLVVFSNIPLSAFVHKFLCRSTRYAVE